MHLLAHLTHGDELSFEPGVILDGLEAGQLTAGHVDYAVVHVRVLGGGVVSPDNDIPHATGRDTTAHGHLQPAAANDGQVAHSGITSSIGGFYATLKVLLHIIITKSCHLPYDLKIHPFLQHQVSKETWHTEFLKALMTFNISH